MQKNKRFRERERMLEFNLQKQIIINRSTYNKGNIKLRNSRIEK
jgi:hypothetical protein